MKKPLIENLEILKLHERNLVTLNDVRKSFKMLAFQYHPDRGGNEEQFKRLREAYEQIVAGREYAPGETIVFERIKSAEHQAHYAAQHANYDIKNDPLGSIISAALEIVSEQEKHSGALDLPYEGKLKAIRAVTDVLLKDMTANKDLWAIALTQTPSTHSEIVYRDRDRTHLVGGFYFTLNGALMDAAHGSPLHEGRSPEGIIARVIGAYLPHKLQGLRTEALVQLPQSSGLFLS